MHTLKNKQKLVARVKRIQGQAAALEKQLEQESDCVSVLQQIAAIRGAINGLMSSVLEGHLSEHLVEEPDLSKRQDELEVVLKVVKSYLK